jgi:glycosyltransferase involved in cell wall biosynthesis
VLARVAGGVAEPGRRVDYYLGREDFRFPGTRRLLELPPERPDVIHAHNLHGGYFDLRLLPALSAEVPLVLTLHDAWLLSGHCAHSLDCDRWRTGCGKCPDLSLYPAVRRDATAFNWRRKRDIFGGSTVRVAIPSRWLLRRVERSLLASAVVEARVIPNGVDLSTFRPGDSGRARAAVGLPADAQVLLTTALDARRSRWKDFSQLREAVGVLAAQRREAPLHVVVLGTDAEPERVGEATIAFVPYVPDAAVAAAYYRAADVYVHPTRADTFPTAVLEALASGTPVVASRVGGIPEQLDDGESGFLVERGDAKALAARVSLLLSDARLREQVGRQGRARASRSFDFGRQVEAYLDWYADLAREAGRRTA